jgi:hypothetical protein
LPAIDEAIAGKQRMLDVGNGGVFDYDTSLVGEIVGVDLFLDESRPPAVPVNVTLRQGDALALAEPDASFETVLSAFVFHHLISTDVPKTIENIRTAIAESRRVLEPGGEFIVAESCVSPGAYAIERRLFAALRRVASTRLMKHPATLQLTPAMVIGFLEDSFENVSGTPIPVGRVVLQFGHQWPTALTPARPYLFRAH